LKECGVTVATSPTRMGEAMLAASKGAGKGAGGKKKASPVL